MIFRGTRIRRDEHGRCGLLSKRIFSNKKAESLASDTGATIGWATYTFRLRTVTSTKILSMADGMDRHQFHMTQARYREKELQQNRVGKTIAWWFEGAWEEGLAQFARERGLCQESIGESS
ncbi:MAG: hypothetical protein OJF47_001039 [Nitrospira sp.]|jgi:hypothetical protein|nr:MAG: hypothetical protein OJF47_001039 [Nitrospira sp.]